jgi:hypothetical protein
MSTTLYLVSSGECFPLTADARSFLIINQFPGYDLSRGGVDWLLALAADEDEALSQAEAWDAVPETNGEALMRHLVRLEGIALTLHMEGRYEEARSVRGMGHAQEESLAW